MEYPLTVTKSELKRALGITNDRRWRQKVMTDQVITEVLNMSIAEFKSVHEFDVLKTRVIIDFFRIPPERFNYQ